MELVTLLQLQVVLEGAETEEALDPRVEQGLQTLVVALVVEDIQEMVELVVLV